MSKVNIGIAMIVVGMVGLIASLFIDLVGLGYPGFHGAQILGLAVSAVLVLAGGWMLMRERRV